MNDSVKQKKINLLQKFKKWSSVGIELQTWLQSKHYGTTEAQYFHSYDINYNVISSWNF